MVANLVRTRPRRSLSIIKFGNKVNDTGEILKIYIGKCVKSLNRDFKEYLKKDPEWAPLVPFAKVSIINNKINVRVEHPMAEELEYGTPDRPSNPKIRKFMMIARERLVQDVSSDLKKVLK